MIFVFVIIIVCFNSSMGRPVPQFLHPIEIVQEANTVRTEQNVTKHRNIQWPPDHNTYYLPKPLNDHDRIMISGQLLKHHESVVLALMTEKGKTFEINADFKENNITLLVYKNGQKIVKDAEYFDTKDMFPDSNFKLKLTLYSENQENVVDVKVSNMSLQMEKIYSQIQDISYLTVKGVKVDGISFEFDEKNI